MRGSCVPRSFAACVFVAIALLMSPSTVSGQVIQQLLAPGGDRKGLDGIVPPAEEERALDTAERSFDRTAERRARRALEDSGRSSGEMERALREQVDRMSEAFARRVREDLFDAKGDGLLTFGELSEEIGEAREQSLEDLERRLNAIRDGANPPPVLDEFDRLRDFVVAMARYVLVARNAPARWGIAVLCLVGLVAGARMVSFALGRLAASDRMARWGRLPESLSLEPLYVLAVAAGIYVARSLIWLPLEFARWLGSLSAFLATLGLAWLWWRASNPMGRSVVGWIFGHDSHAKEEAVDVVRKVFRLAGMLVLALALARVLFDVSLSTLIAGVGVLGIAASVAAQDTLRNLVASVTLHSDRPFAPGHLVRFQGHLGKIEEIGFRSTRLRTLDGPVVIVPNVEMVRENVQNLTARRHLRHHDSIDLVYQTTPEHVRKAIEIAEQVLAARDFEDGHEPHVVFDGFGAHSLRIALWYTSETGDYFEALEDRSAVNLEILERFNEAGLEFAYPTRTLHIATEADGSSDAGDAPGD